MIHAHTWTKDGIYVGKINVHRSFHWWHFDFSHMHIYRCIYEHPCLASSWHWSPFTSALYPSPLHFSVLFSYQSTLILPFLHSWPVLWTPYTIIINYPTSVSGNSKVSLVFSFLSVTSSDWPSSMLSLMAKQFPSLLLSSCYFLYTEESLSRWFSEWDFLWLHIPLQFYVPLCSRGGLGHLGWARQWCWFEECCWLWTWKFSLMWPSSKQFGCAQQRSDRKPSACSVRAVLSELLQMLHPLGTQTSSLCTWVGVPWNPTSHAAAMSRDSICIISLLPLLESSKKEILWQERRNQVKAEQKKKVWGEKGLGGQSRVQE